MPLNVLRPCWTSVTSGSSAQKQAAKRHRKTAARHRSAAERLRSAERAACAGLGIAEISTSPFWHRADIAATHKIYENGRLAGARIVFKQVPGLTVAWLRRASECHRARAASLGHPVAFMTYCPLVIPGALIDVRAHPRGLQVDVRASATSAATEVWNRARKLPLPIIRTTGQQ